MASHTANRVQSATLSASTVDDVTLAGAFGYVEVFNRAGSGGGISFTVNGDTPTVLGDDCYVVGPGQAVVVPAPVDDSLPNSTVVKLISSSADPYTVTGVIR